MNTRNNIMQNMEYSMFPKFRFDDVCINSNMELTNSLTSHIINVFDGKAEIIWGVSPLVHDMSDYHGKAKQRIFPEILNAHSDWREFYQIDKCGIPPLRNDVTLAGHGLWHVDHRLLHYSVQEASIITSCALVNSVIFIPPFNKYDSATQLICDEHGIELIKFEDGWRSMEYNSYDIEHGKYYLHAREWTMEKLIEWFK